MDLALLDTNVLVYAYQSLSKFCTSSREFMRY